MECPVCHIDVSKEMYDINGFRIVKCINCSHFYTDMAVSTDIVNKVYSDDYFYGGKDGYPDYTLERDILIERGEKYADIAEKYMPAGTLLDVGAAAGFIMKGFENRGWKVTGVEPNSTMALYGKEKLGLDIRVSTIEEGERNIEVDLVLLIQVLAHLYNLDRSLDSIKAILRQGGYLLLETWNKDSLTAKLLGKHWHEFSPPSTLNYFSKKTIDLLMEKNGFMKIASGRPGKKIHSRHAKSLLSHKLKSSKILKWISGIEKLIPSDLHLKYPSEDLFWALYKRVDINYLT